MSSEQAIFLLVFGFLIVTLCFALLVAFAIEWIASRVRLTPRLEGAGFDPRPILPSIQRVRGDYATALHRHPHPGTHSRRLSLSVRTSIASLPFFQDRQASEVDSLHQAATPPG